MAVEDINKSDKSFHIDFQYKMPTSNVQARAGTDENGDFKFVVKQESDFSELIKSFFTKYQNRQEKKHG
jgi:hypothetical protein